MKRKWIAGLLAAVLTAVSALSYVPGPMRVAEAADDDGGTTYYVSSKNGDDKNDGTSESKPFKTLDKINEITLQPGDEVLLERGSVFTNQYLHLKGSGSAEAPIEIKPYGEGSVRPRIDTNRKGVWMQDYGIKLDSATHKYKGEVSTSVLLFDVEYIEISGLEITNDYETSEHPNNEQKNDTELIDRTGVAGIAQDKGTLEHIYLDDLYIHDVDGNIYDKHMANGGIYFMAHKPKDEAATGISRFDDLRITNCYLDTVNRWGIAAAYTAYHAQFGSAEISDDVIQKYGATNVYIANNYIKSAGGDAITTMYCDRPVIEYNVAQDCAWQISEEHYNKPGNKGGRVAAGIWPWKCKNALFQYNECFAMQNGFHGNQDAQAWDADWGDGTNYQYNYSHGNTGGAVMFCGVQAINNTFRYNISQNELKGPLNIPSNPDAHVYNNTFYIEDGVSFVRDDMNNGPTKVENNIIYYSGDAPKQENWRTGNVTYDNNLYYNYANLPDNDANAVNVSAGTKVLENPGTAPTQAADDGHSRLAAGETGLFEGYKPAENSPAINRGKVIADDNGYAPAETDFFGKAMSVIPEIGAAESDAISMSVTSRIYEVSDDGISGLAKNTTLEVFLSNLRYDTGVKITVRDKETELTDKEAIVRGGMTVTLSYEGQEDRVYTILANSDNELKETVYMLNGTTLYVPYTETNPIKAGEIKKNITVHETADIKIMNNGEKVGNNESVKDGMVLCITAENGAENTYTIKQKNEYQWSLDYEGYQQGNVWFAQIRNSAEEEWSNMTAYDGQWPNWVVNTYYGVGVDGPEHNGTYITQTDENTHGLLIANPGVKDQEIAMAFRAPKSGTVSFSVKDSCTHGNHPKEPYIRQAGNNGGSVRVSLLVNGEEKQTAVMSESFISAADWSAFDAIELRAGDYVRVAVKAEGNPTKSSIHITPAIAYQDVPVTPEKDSEAPMIPDALSVGEITEDSAVLTWEEPYDNVGVAGYRVFVDGVQVNEELLSETTMTLTGLTPDTVYKATVEAVDAAGNASGQSAVCSFTTKEKETPDPGPDPDPTPDPDPNPDPKPDPNPTPTPDPNPNPDPNPGKPDAKPSGKPDSGASENKAVKTGDDTNPIFWGMLSLLGGIAVITVLKKREKQ